MSGIAGLRLLWLLLLIGLVAAAPNALAGGRQDLVAHGSGDRFWLARVLTDSGAVRTRVYARAVGESGWALVAQVEARVVAMAHRGPQLALLLDDGDWLLVSEDALVTGRPLPGGAMMLDIASGGDTLFALARARLPAAGPEPSFRLALFSLTPGGWVETGDLGTTGSPARSDVSLAFVDSAVHVALRDGQNAGRVRLLRQTPERTWADAGAADVPPGSVALKLLGGGPVPVLWALRPDGGYSLNWFTRQGVPPKTFDPPAGVDPSEVAAALAIERVRILYAAGKYLYEQTEDPLPVALSELPATGPSKAPASRPASGPAPRATRILLPGRSIVPWLSRWVQPLLTVALLFTVVASLRQHRQMQEAMSTAHKLPLAPPGRRLAAGIIDALPLVAAAVVLFVRERQLDDPATFWDDWTVRITAIGGVALYFLHTALTEMLLGRSIGKMAFGLRVVALDGKRPTAGALLTRNLLRIIDVMIGFFPLVLVLYSPLRQRAGDVAAGTIVVMGGTEEEKG